MDHWLRGESFYVTLLVASILVTRLVQLLFAPEFWLDEAMLGVNVRDVPYSDFFQPLPFYEQSAPLGFLLLSKALGSLFDYALPALRAVPWLVSLLAAYWVYRAARMLLDRRAAALVTAVSALNPMAVRYAIEFKQYGVEMALGALFVYLVLRVSRLGYRSADIVWLGLTATAGFLFSNTVPLLLAAFGPVLFVHSMWVNRGLRRPSVELAVAGVVAGVVTGIYYLALAKPLLLYQFEGYAHIYQDAYAPHSLMAIPWLAEHLYTVVFSTLGPPEVVKPLYLPLAMIGGWHLAGRSRVLVGGALALLILLGLLSYLHVIPLGNHRHLLFMAPLVAFFVGTGAFVAIQWVCKRRSSGRCTGPALALALAAIAVIALYRATHLEKQRITPLLQTLVRDTTKTPVWVYYGALPAFRWYAPGSGLAQPILYNAVERSSVPGWLSLVRFDFERYLASFTAAVSPYSRVWLLFSHHEMRERNQIISAANAAGFDCPLVQSAIGTLLYRCAR